MPSPPISPNSVSSPAHATRYDGTGSGLEPLPRRCRARRTRCRHAPTRCPPHAGRSRPGDPIGSTCPRPTSRSRAGGTQVPSHRASIGRWWGCRAPTTTSSRPSDVTAMGPTKPSCGLSTTPVGAPVLRLRSSMVPRSRRSRSLELQRGGDPRTRIGLPRFRTPATNDSGLSRSVRAIRPSPVVTTSRSERTAIDTFDDSGRHGDHRLTSRRRGSMMRSCPRRS